MVKYYFRGTVNGDRGGSTGSYRTGSYRITHGGGAYDSIGCGTSVIVDSDDSCEGGDQVKLLL